MRSALYIIYGLSLLVGPYSGLVSLESWKESRNPCMKIRIFVGVSESSQKSRNLCRNLGIFAGISESLQESRNLRRNLGILLSSQESSKESQNLGGYLEESWNQQEFRADSESRRWYFPVTNPSTRAFFLSLCKMKKGLATPDYPKCIKYVLEVYKYSWPTIDWGRLASSFYFGSCVNFLWSDYFYGPVI